MTMLIDRTLPGDVVHFDNPTLYVKRTCLTCGVPTLYLAYTVYGVRSERTLAGCPDHRLHPHCVFCCAGIPA